MNSEHLSLFWLFWAEKLLIFIDNIDKNDLLSLLILYIYPYENKLVWNN